MDRSDGYSKKGFTYLDEKNVSPEMKYLTLLGWGNDTESTYSRGKYIVEIWYKNQLIAKSHFLVQ
jgi:hypothetical protein